MESIRTIVQALAVKDVEGIKESFYRENDKVALLFSMLLNNNTNEEIKESLGLTANAYSTLRSRLHSKVQNQLIELSGSPRADVLNKLLSIDEIVFSLRPTIALTTLKKLEHELIRYDLSSELTTVYKYLKKLHLNTAEYFHYSQLYNRHVAYSLALDKAEDLLGKYFKEYGLYYIMGDASKKLELTVLFEEMKNVCALYQSHRMSVYLASLQIFHCLFVNESAFDQYGLDPIEDVLEQVEDTFKKYPNDNIYVHLHLLFNYIRFEYYAKHGVIPKAKILLEEIYPQIPKLLVHYENYNFPAQLLISRLKLKFNSHLDIPAISEHRLFEEFSIGNSSTSARVVYYIYRALTAFYIREYADASKWLFELNNEVSFKEHHKLLLEVKCLTAYIKFIQQDNILFRQNLTSSQRILRIIGAEKAAHLTVFVKILGILNSESNKNKALKLQRQLDIIRQFKFKGFQPTLYINLELESLLKLLS